jgi:FlaA1/EpsC-like NDP-sugar epimerase
LRLASRTTQAAIDLAILSLAYWAAWLFRFDLQLPLQMFKRAMFAWPYVAGLEYGVLVLFAVPRFAWRYFSLREAVRVAQAAALVATVLIIARLVGSPLSSTLPHSQYAMIPVGVTALNCALSIFGIGGIRATRRIWAEQASSKLHRRSSKALVPTLLIGAGQAGALVAKEIANRPDLGIEPVGFLDDDRSKLGTLVHGIRVFGTADELAKYAATLDAKQVLVTIAELEPNVLRRILRLCEDAALPAKLLPGLYQVIEEQAGLGRLRDVSIEDLLGRETVKLDMQLVVSFVKGKRVLVTGAGGSIGAELCRQVARFGPAQLILVERAEFALFAIEQELRKSRPNVQIVPRICDICDEPRLRAVFQADQPQIVFHAAAHKHVPMMEHNPGEAVKNNVFGTKLLADVAGDYGIEAFVMISTDKAVNPSSIMGATKRVAEVYIQALSARSQTKYVAVRFGNVLGSTGSVIPTFKDQIAAGGPVTVTHPEMKRYFMTIPEASQLVMQAAAMGKGGEIFVLDMGTPVRIVDLAHDLIRLSGLVPEVDIKITFTGMRPGEKLFEELSFDAERMSKTAHPKIYIGKLEASDWNQVQAHLALLLPQQCSMSESEVRYALRQIIPDMAPTSVIPARPAGEPAGASDERAAVGIAGAIHAPATNTPGQASTPREPALG